MGGWRGRESRRTRGGWMCALLLATCTPDATRRVAMEVPSLDVSSEEIVTLAASDDREFFVTGHSFDAQKGLEAGLSSRLDGRYVLEFLPLFDGEGLPAATHLWVTVVAEDGEELIRQSVPAYSLESLRERPTGALGVLRKTSRLSLAAADGHEVSVRWDFKSRIPGARGILANAKLRREPEPDESRAARALPPILFICSDTHRRDHAMGEEVLGDLMPRLGAFAKGAVAYPRTFSTASWTLPAVTSAFTGLFPRRHTTGLRVSEGMSARVDEVPDGLFGFGNPDAGRYRLFRAFPDGIDTLPHHLRRYGYETVLLTANGLLTMSGLAQRGGDIVVDAGLRTGGELVELAGRILESLPADQPVFLFVHFMDVHHWKPWHFNESHPDQDPDDAVEGARGSYRAAVAEADVAIGDLLDLWGERYAMESSLVVFFSDHGEGLRAGAMGHGRDTEESLLNVPLYVRYPDAMGVPAGTDSGARSLVDLLPTVLDVLDAEKRPALDGISLLTPPAAGGERLLYSDYQLFGPELSTVRRGNLKMTLDGAGKVLSLRRVSEDGAQETDVDDPQARADLAKNFDAYRIRSGAAAEGLRSSRRNDPVAARARLEALGYVE